MGPGEGFAVPGLETDPDPYVGAFRRVTDAVESSGNRRFRLSSPGELRLDDPRECECERGGRALSSAACISAAGMGTHLFFFPDPLGNTAPSSGLSSRPLTDEARVLPPLGWLLFAHGGLFRVSASAGNSLSRASPADRVWLSRAAQIFLAGADEGEKDGAPLILGVWLSSGVEAGE